MKREWNPESSEEPIRCCSALISLIGILALVGCGAESDELTANGSATGQVSNPLDQAATNGRSGAGDNQFQPDRNRPDGSPGGLTDTPSEATVSDAVSRKADGDRTSVPALTIVPATGKTGEVNSSIALESQIFDADRVTLEEETMVIGVVIDDQSRAYVIDAMAVTAGSVVNDMLRQTPVTVTYCAGTKAVRVFTAPTSGKRLSISVSSASTEGMSIGLDGLIYDHSSLTIPLDDVDFVQTAWIAWKSEHPETTVYLGALAEKYSTAE